MARTLSNGVAGSPSHGVLRAAAMRPCLPSSERNALASGRTSALVADLLAFLHQSPSPFHCAAECSRRLQRSGFIRLHAARAWPALRPACGYFSVGASHLIAFRVGTERIERAGARIVAAHTDSPGLRLQPRATRLPPRTHSEGRVDVDVYGSPLLYTWLDRDLGLAGRLVVERNGRLQTRRVHVQAPIARIPSLAIHLQPQVNEAGLVLNRAQHLPAILCSANGAAPQRVLTQLLGEALGEQAGTLRAHELFLVDTQPAALTGASGEFIQAGRLDDQAMCHAALSALMAACPGRALQVVALFDHEEIGSHTERGADATLLTRVLGRIADLRSGSLERMAARSLLVSADMGHAVHPNYPQLHDEAYRPRLNLGPMLKTNANGHFGTSARAHGMLRALCARNEIPLQEYVMRPDLHCGSTLGPKAAAWLGIPAVDIGSPLLSMHSIREMAGTRDHAPMLRLLAAFLEC